MKFNLINIDNLPFFDTHMHSVSHGPEMANYTIDSVKSCIDNCAKIGKKIVCLTDHIPLPLNEMDPTADKDCGLPLKNFIEVLVTNRKELKSYTKQRGITLYIGGEFDFFADYKKFYDEFDKTFKPELKVLGQHFIDSIDVYPDKNGLDCYGEKIAGKQRKNFCFDFSENAFAFGVEQKGANALVKRYFELLEEALASQNYDIVAHIDLINKYNDENKYFKEDNKYRQMIKRILKLVSDKNIALEINLSATEFMKRLVPREWIIKEASARNIPITLGSDVHGYESKPMDQRKIIKMLKEIGIKEIAVPE